ncbi:MAG: type I 3-dehydroquinate dehydratase [Kiritimatiellae bacterium]|nr:type I 3-dehydroquinate dehydratase [Kiritimatiellia bacterium]MCO5069565.1 type I 3-dehydroquinate dehydratase [Kiritimatiellia bacterium]
MHDKSPVEPSNGRALTRVVGVASCVETLSHLHKARAVCDWVEVRADLMGADADAWLRAHAPSSDLPPILLTIRSAREGGKWGGSEEERIQRYADLLPHVFAVDVELDSGALPEVVKRARAARRTVIGSFHDFHATPDEEHLRSLVMRGEQAGASMVKLAVWTASESDIQRLENVLHNPPSGIPLALMGMGPLGIASRLRLAETGSALVYGFLDSESAPGQLSSAELVERLTALIPAYRRYRSDADA